MKIEKSMSFKGKTGFIQIKLIMCFRLSRVDSIISSLKSLKHSNVLIALGSTLVFSVAGASCHKTLLITKVVFYSSTTWISTHFCFLRNLSPLEFFWAQDRFLVGAGGGCGRHDFLAWLLFMGFPIVYDKTLLKDNPFLLVFGLRYDFWVGKLLEEADFFFLSVINLLSMAWAFQQYMTWP